MGGASRAPVCTHSRADGIVATTLLRSERGWLVRFTLVSLDANNLPNPDGSSTVVYRQMDITAPDKISDLTSDIKAGDGRHRKFSWGVPRDNGSPITGYVLRRADVSLQTTDYIFMCNSTSASNLYPNPDPTAGTGPSECSSTSIACWTSRFYCTGSYTPDVYLTAWTGLGVSVIVGSDEDQGNGTYLVPTEQYTWSVIALNSENAACNRDSSCNNNLEDGSGWSEALTVSQTEATPQPATNLSVVRIDQTALTLAWTAPDSNGAALLSYRVECLDSQAAYVTSQWAQPTIVRRVRVEARATARATARARLRLELRAGVGVGVGVRLGLG